MKNIILIVLDTFRADYLSDYGGRGRLKNLESLAGNSVVYTSAVAPSTYTVPSHASIFLGKRVVEIPEVMRGHGKEIGRSLPRYMKKGELSLAKKLEYIGFKSALFSSNPFVTEATGLAEGFSYTRDIVKDRKDRPGSFAPLEMMVNSRIAKKSFIGIMNGLSRVVPGKVLDDIFVKVEMRLEQSLSGESGYRDIDMGARSINRWVAEYSTGRKNSRNFVFINYMEAHDAYPTYLVSDEPVVQDRWLYMSGMVSEKGVDLIKKACWKRLEYLDGKIGELIETLKRRHMLDDAVLIVTSDHGQAFMEHGQMYHGLLPYSEIVNVPLVVSTFKNGRVVKNRRRISKVVGIMALHDAIIDAAYGKDDWIERLSERETVYSDHIGLVGWWGSEVVGALKDRLSHFKKLHEVMRLYDRRATAIYRNGYKVMHFKKSADDEMYRVSDRSDSRNIRHMNAADYRKVLGSARS